MNNDIDYVVNEELKISKNTKAQEFEKEVYLEKQFETVIKLLESPNSELKMVYDERMRNIKFSLVIIRRICYLHNINRYLQTLWEYVIWEEISIQELIVFLKYLKTLI